MAAIADLQDTDVLYAILDRPSHATEP